MNTVEGASAVTEPEEKKSGHPGNFYTVYDSRTDDILASGTAKECAAGLGLAADASFYSLLWYLPHRKHSNYVVVIEDLITGEMRTLFPLDGAPEAGEMI